MKKPEIFSSCCAFGSDGTENVFVEFDSCPIKRDTGSRERNKYVAVPEGVENPTVKEACCTAFSGLRAEYTVPTCPYYQGTKIVTRNKKKVYKVLCSAIELDRGIDHDSE